MAYLWLRQLLGQMLPELENLPAGPAGEAPARAWFERLLARFAERGLITPAQQKNRVVDVRNAIRAHFSDDHPSLAFVGFNEATWQTINLPTHDRTEARNENQRLLRYPEKIVARAAKLLESTQFEDLAVGLGLTVGRRMSELLDGHARLEPATAWSVRFTGQRKHKGNREDFCFEIPTLAPAEKVLGAWQRLQVMLGDEILAPQSINNRYGYAVNQAADHHFRGLIPPRLPPTPRKGKEGALDDPHARERPSDALYLHLFRAVYATVAVHWFCPPRVNRLVYKAEIQGHRRVLDAPTRAMRRSYTAARHYDDYQVADASGKNLDGRQGIKLGKLPGLEVLQAFRDGAHPKVMLPTPRPTPPKPALTPATPVPPVAETAIAPLPPRPSLAPDAMDSAPATATHDAPPAPEQPPTHEAAGDDGSAAPKEKKPRPVTYRIYPADRPRLDAFRTEPKQTQADNLQGVIELLENASAAIQAQDQMQDKLQEALTRAEQAETQRAQAEAERQQARQEVRETAGRLQTKEGELQRLQQVLEQARGQATAGNTRAAGGSPIALAVVARELLALATEESCPAMFQGRLIALATQALGVNQTSSPEKLQQEVSPARIVAAPGQSGQRKAARAGGDEGRLGPLFAASAAATSRPATDVDDQNPRPQPPTPILEEPVEQPAGGNHPAGTTEPPADAAHPKGIIVPPTQDFQEMPRAAEANRLPGAAGAFTRRGGASDKLERALGAVLAHNEAQTAREKKWAVTESALARLTGCFRPAIRTFFAARAQQIEAHNQTHYLSGGHNAARGKRGETIEAEVRWREERVAPGGADQEAGDKPDGSGASEALAVDEAETK